MNKHLLKSIALLLSVLSLLFCSVPAISAEEMEEIITGEHELTIRPPDQNSGYVYINAEVPNGWGGKIRMTFHSCSTGKDYICTMSYLENEYYTGLWLPAGIYEVSTELPDDDGLCVLDLRGQETLEIGKGQDIYLTILAQETESTDSVPEAAGSTVVPPMPPEEYEDLPTAPTDSAPAATAVAQEPIPEENAGSGIAPVISLVLGLLVVILGWLIHRWKNKQ